MLHTFAWLLPTLLLGTYLTGVVVRLRAGGEWDGLRLGSFVVGCALLVLALLPPLMAWAHADPRGHMLQHLLLGMFAPLALMLGRPLSLLLRTLPQRHARQAVLVLGSAPMLALTHPVTALLLDVGGLYLLYLTPLFAASLEDALLGGWLHLHFLLAGYLFAWSIAGPDPAPARPGFGLRLGVLFVAIAAHGILAKLMYGYGFPRGTAFMPEQLEAAARLMYYGGSLAELLLVALLFAGRQGRRWRAGVLAPQGLSR
ncbi:cytochrome c oxidase assembly protein [Stutzerimonas azotifigens]|uniref:Cytochrome c oxidase assembly protein n=1 Tax=Stutzerimonas azotifigens TaxID=291995 RepID=A0ABR5Z437_9GAMM|nr:cytochrome c oxidase assembly protein [Stutzerimonas azotifigens]MBA1274899.1 cytochrome c oxidase assembly protein [Stutzerimonas azotifigens]